MEMQEYKGGFTDLQVWKESRNFRNEISSMAKNLPEIEKYRLQDQIIRASRRVTACIAEGYGRYHYQENIQFCRQSRGSLMECFDHLTCAFDENYIDQNQFETYRNHYFKILKMLNGYISYLQKQKNKSTTKP